MKIAAAQHKPRRVVAQGPTRPPRHGWSRRRLSPIALAILALALLGPSTASASKQIIGYIGATPGKNIYGRGTLGGEFTNPVGVVVNNSGAGPANKGDIYVVDTANNRIQRFAHADNGTPANPEDDSYPFLSAWGAGVESGGSNYEICAAATQCKAALASGGNGTVSGDGALDLPDGIALDQDSGDVYVSDAHNARVDVYDGVGAFLRSFGFDVVQSGPDDAGAGYEVCVAANGDVCKAGLAGSGIGQIGKAFNSHTGIAVSPPDGNPATGAVFLADNGFGATGEFSSFGSNQRVNTYDLDGGSPSSFGSAALFSDCCSPSPGALGIDSNGVVYVSNSINSNEIERYDSEDANGGGVGFLSPIAAPPLSPTSFSTRDATRGLVTDFGSGALYVLRGGVVQQYGPVNPAGLTVPSAAVDEVHGESAELGPELGDGNGGNGLGFDESDGSIYVVTGGGGTQKNAEGVYVLNTRTTGPPTASLDSLSSVTSHSVTVHATVNPNGPPSVAYVLEYSTDGTMWNPTPEVTIGVQDTPQTIEAVLDPPLGLKPNTFYHVRMKVHKLFISPVVTGEKTFTTLAAPPSVETTGSPVRTATTARLEGRVNPGNSAASYHFEYGQSGPCDANPCTATEAHVAGAGGAIELVSQQLEGLEPGTTYDYRVVADNGDADGPVFGEDMTLTTHPSDAILSHGHFPGPPGSDRAWEQVNAPDTGGNPVLGASAIAEDGSSAVYRVSGGTPDSTIGSFFDQLFAERTPTGWKARAIYPSREEAKGNTWFSPAGSSDLSSLIGQNFTGGFAPAEYTIWQMSPSGPATKVFGVEQAAWTRFTAVSDDASRVVTLLTGSLDPAHPVTPGTKNLYDVSSGEAHLIALLPDGSVPVCGEQSGPSGLPSGVLALRRAPHWLSADGSLAFFPTKGNSCGGPRLLYARDIEAETTRLISTPALSGLECDAAFIKWTPGAAFFYTPSRLVAKDTDPENCSGVDGDVYRYDLGDDTLSCVTCVAPGVDAEVIIANSMPALVSADIGVAEDGSRVYFTATNRLLPGTAPDGAYRVNVATGDLAYIGHLGASVGDSLGSSNSITPDGSVITFRSNDPSLDALGGQQNAGTKQYYRYDDRDRSLICVSCPQDGTQPRASASGPGGVEDLGPNITALDDAGDFIFSAPTALLATDQNTAGPGQNPGAGNDVYEWRDGRVLLVSDGLTNWPVVGDTAESPQVSGITPSGRDVFFTESAQLTPDALDGYRRLYDARIGGGIEFSTPPKPCPLEVCQGTPKGAPEEAAPGTGSFMGPGNLQARHPKKKKHKKKHHKKQARHSHKANQNRRAAR